MSEAELLFTALDEMSTRQIAKTLESKGLEENKIPAKKGGKIANNAKIELEQQTGQKIVNTRNFLPKPDNKKELN
ncbi:MAG: DNA-damage-inducible protein D [Rickettsiales bacterium]|jgi:DNA-damage-inducible protein D